MPEIIFILGVEQRSGTHFLQDLLFLHEECGRGRIPEDFILANAGLLDRYFRSIFESWNPTWYARTRAGLEAEFAAGVGAAMLAACAGDRPLRYVTMKTPSTDQIERIFSFFPAARVLVMMRDGRDVIQSGVQSFGWNWEAGVRRWRESADRIAAFLETPRGREQAMLIRYEDLFADTEGQIRRILDFLGLDAARYDFARAATLPVRGSSEFGRDGAVHWMPVPRTADFAPIGRHRQWTRRQRQRFAWLAGAASTHFGYAPGQADAGTWLTRALDRWLDRVWALRCRLDAMKFLLGRALWAPMPDLSDRSSHYYRWAGARWEQLVPGGDTLLGSGSSAASSPRRRSIDRASSSLARAGETTERPPLGQGLGVADRASTQRRHDDGDHGARATPVESTPR